MPRTFRERPRLALMVGLGLACLIGIGALAGVVLAGGSDDSSPEVRNSEAQARQAEQRLKAARLEAEEANEELAGAREQAERVQRAGAGQRARAESWRARAQRLERRNRALRRALAQARED